MTDRHLFERSVPETRVRALVGMAALAAVLFVGVYLVAVHTEWGQRLDATALAGGARVDRPRVEKATEDLLTTISVASVALVGGGIVLAALARRRFHLALGAGIVVFGSDVSAELCKRVIFARPDLLATVDSGSLDNSYPSGHTTVAMSLALAAVLVTPRRARGVVAVLAGAYAVAIGEGVLVSGWHRPSDAIGSYLLVLVWATLAAAWLAATRARLVRRPGSSTSARPFVGPVLAAVGVAALGVSFVGMATVAVAVRAARLDSLDLDTAYLAASTAILGVGVLVVTTFVFMIRGVTFDPRDPV